MRRGLDLPSLLQQRRRKARSHEDPQTRWPEVEGIATIADSRAQLEQRLAGLPSGAVVTSVTVDAADPRRRRIAVGGRLVARLTDLEVDRIGIAEGTVWTDSLADAVRDAVDCELTHDTALRLLARRGLSRRELTARLVAGGSRDTVAAEVVDRLGQAGYLNDDALAESVCRQVRRRGPTGPRLLEEQLTRRQVDPDAARTAVQRALRETDLVDEAVRLGRRRLAVVKRLPRDAAIRRLAGILARRGFDEETVASALRRLDLDPDSPEDGILE